LLTAFLVFFIFAYARVYFLGKTFLTDWINVKVVNTTYTVKQNMPPNSNKCPGMKPPI